MFPFKVPEKFRIIAHRGASAYAPENTMAAFKLAMETGAEEVELDVQLSSDGIPFICHDAVLSRYGHENVILEETCSEKLLSLDMGSWFSPYQFKGERMIKLSELFDEFRNTFTYHIEIKGSAPALIRETLRTIQSAKLMDNCIFTSFKKDALSEFKSLVPSAKRGWLVAEQTDEILSICGELGLFQICPKLEKLTPEHVEKAQRAGLESRVWGISTNPVKAKEDIQYALSCDCDGMTINWPDWLTHG
ncbi:MAG: hypothetical protein A2017_01170 [Lentisphaerae bacterium GWF2_44_16]|nr:MAG: hypothetical protein A2017_01170 [Lentisphaerae bacterium GWF2_44_16]